MHTTNPKTHALRTFFAGGRPAQYHKHQAIWHENEPPEMFFVESGFVKAYTITPQGFSNTLLIYTENDIFPLSLLYPSQYRGQFFYKAMSGVQLRRVTRNQLIAGISANSNLAGAVFDRALSALSVFAYRLQNLQQRSARERVIFCLLHLASRHGVTQESGVSIAVPLTHQDLAEAVNSTRETVSREIERLAREGIVLQKSRTIEILDYQRMVQELEAEPQLFTRLIR